MGAYTENRRILYVDDEEALLASFRSLVKPLGVETHLLRDSTQIESILKQEGPFAAVLSDQRMPGLDGVAVLEAVRRLQPDTIRIMITGHADLEETRRAVNDVGIAHHVTKPWNDDELRRLTTACITRYNLARENSFLLEEVAAVNASHRRLAEQHLRETEEQFRLMAENVEDLVAVVDREGKRIYNSPSYRGILGDIELLKGTDVFNEIHPDDRDRAKKVFRKIVLTGVPERIEYRVLAKDGSVRTIESKGGVIRDGDGKITHGIVVSRDVTEERRLAAQFLRAQRMESIGTLAGGIAHDLNNVLTPIIMSIEILKRKAADAGTLKLLSTIDTSAKRGSDIVRQVLAFGRGVKGDRIQVQVKHVVSEVASISGETFPKSIVITSDIPRDLWVINADPTQMHQVFLNLFVNARDAMPGGGTLAITASNVTLDECSAGMHADAKPGRYICVTVSDTGTGIPETIRSKIFDPFFTTKELGSGTGLGLSTTLTIVKNHGGFIGLESRMGKGTSFSVYFPAVSPATAAGESAGENLLPTGSGELVLIIDDESAIREIARETLQTYGYRVITASNGADGITSFGLQRDGIHAVITDMMMPVMNGAAVIQELRKMRPDVRIVAVSGMAAGGPVAASPPDGVHAFLAKPYTAGTLLTTLAKVLQ